MTVAAVDKCCFHALQAFFTRQVSEPDGPRFLRRGVDRVPNVDDEFSGCTQSSADTIDVGHDFTCR